MSALGFQAEGSNSKYWCQVSLACLSVSACFRQVSIAGGFRDPRDG